MTSVLSVAGFTNLGFLSHSRRFDPSTVDMSGRTVAITGATGGLGKAAAERLAGMGARVIIVGRSDEKLRAAERDIRGDVFGYRADLSLMREIRGLAKSILDHEERIDVLVNNVGVLLPDRELTDEGLEKTLAVDLAGHFLLTNLLLPRLIESRPSRVINVTSGGMYAVRACPEDLNFELGVYRGATAYARAKRGQVILTRLWAERLAGSGVTFHAMHPGWAKTSGVGGSLPTFYKLMRPLLRTPEQGADTMVWLATADDPPRHPGELWFDRSVVESHMVGRTVETDAEREELWSGLARLTESDVPLDRKA